MSCGQNHSFAVLASSLKSRGRRAGMTMLEVIIALAMFGMIAVALLQSVNYGLAALSQDYENDPLAYALSDLRRQILLVASREEVEKGGEGRTSRGERFRWEAELFPTALMDYLQVHVKVDFPVMEGSGEKREMLFHMYRPGWSESREREMLQELRMEHLKQQKEGKMR